MKKVLFVINTLGCGGAERAMLTLLDALDPAVYQLSLFVLTGQGELRPSLPPHVRLLNRQYQDASVMTKEGRRLLLRSVLRAGVGKGLFLRRAPYLLRNLRDMGKKGALLPDKLCWRLLSDGAPPPEEVYDLAVAYIEGGSTYYVAEHVTAKRKAAFVHIDYGQAGYTPSLDLGCYDKFDEIFTVSDEVKTHFLEVYPQYAPKVSVFPNLIDQTRIRALAEQGRGFDDGFQGYRLLSIGRLSQQKRFDIAIEAMALLKKSCDLPVRWYVLGEGELREQLEHQIQSLGVEQEFCLLGVTANPFPYYRECDLYVHATGYEGKSIAIQEAQTLGKPILATDCSGNREQIEQDVDGRLCALDAQCVCEEILWMMDHPDRCKAYGEQARKRILYSLSGFEELIALIGS